jgi:hypothetical protein
VSGESQRLAPPSDLMGHESVPTTAEAGVALASDFNAVFKRDELSGRHNKLSAAASAADAWFEARAPGR